VQEMQGKNYGKAVEKHSTRGQGDGNTLSGEHSGML
jgi:hypothetical protein